MAVKTYYCRFGSGNPATYTGLAPTFIVFRNSAGVTTAPSISEVSTSGIYKFDYECNGTIAFVIDGATTGLVAADRYVAGALDISDRTDEFLGRAGDAVGFSTAYGQILQNQALGNTMLTRIGAITDVSGFSTLFGQAIGAYAYGQTSLARMGSTSDVIGDSATEPTTLYGFLKRVENWLEGRSTYTVATGVLVSYDKTGATTLSSRTIAQSATQVTKT